MKIKEIVRRVTETVGETFDVPAEVAGGLPRVTVTGARRVLIENHRGLLDYDLDRIDVNTGVGIIRIRGEALEITAMSASELVAAGRIISAEFIT